MAPALPTNGLAVATPPADEAAARATAATIARGEVGNAISGTIEVPIDLKRLARYTNGAPPVTLHAFRLTGPLIRDAKVSLFWKDDRAIGYVVDGVPPDYPVVLAATIEPGVVLRTLVPEASPQRPARSQTIDAKSETIVADAYENGIIPPVGLGGMVEVVRQGGLEPARAAEANGLAAADLEKIAVREWGRGIPEAGEAATALKELARTQQEVVGALGAGDAASQGPMRTTGVYAATGQVQSKLEALRRALGERADRGGLPAEAAELITNLTGHLKAAAAADVPQPTVVVPTSRGYSLTQSPLLSLVDGVWVTQAQRRLIELYDQIGFIATANEGFEGPNGQPFSEAEIKAAFSEGKGPYRTTCAQVNFYGDTTCKIVTNPMDNSHEVLLTRNAEHLTTKLAELDEALINATNIFEDPKVATILFEYPAIANFIADDKSRWTSPEGTWRIRLLQDVGAGEGGAGLAIFSDAELFITAAKRPPGFVRAKTAASGMFLHLCSVRA